MQVTIWSHWRGETWTGDVPAPFSNETLFRLFNRVTEADATRLEAWGYTLPSLSVGDTVTWGGETFRVENIGFTPVPDLPRMSDEQDREQYGPIENLS